MKILVRVLIFLALLVVAAQALLSSSLVRDRVEQELEAAVNRDVVVGELDVSLVRSFPTLSVIVRDATIQDSAGTSTPLMTLPTTYVNVALGPLLGGTLACAVAVQEPRIHAQVYTDGTSNLDDLISEDWLAGESDASGFDVIDLRGLSVQGAVLEYRNAAGRELAILDLDATLAAYLAADSTAFAGGVTTQRVRLGAAGLTQAQALPAQLTLQLGMGADATDLRFTEARLAIGAHGIDLTGLPVNWDTVPPLVDLAVRLQGIAEGDVAQQVEAAVTALEAEAEAFIERERQQLRERLGAAVDSLAERGRDVLRDRLGF